MMRSGFKLVALSGISYTAVLVRRMRVMVQLEKILILAVALARRLFLSAKSGNRLNGFTLIFAHRHRAEATV